MFLFVDEFITSRQITHAIWTMAFLSSLSCAQVRPYAGAIGGISTLSADAQSEIAPSGASASSYKPSNGAIVNTFGGVHLNNFFSIQGNYTWNQNALVLFVIRNPDDYYEQHRRSSQQSAAVDLLLYFRHQRSWGRPFLSAGPGVVRFKTDSSGPTLLRGNVRLPPSSISSFKPVLRVAVGLDLRIAHGWAFRYSFLEATQVNPISPSLSPPGDRRLANFQNLFGIMKLF